MSNISVGSKGKVNKNRVNVRVDAGTSYDRVYYAQSGDIVVVQARKTGTDGKLWYKIKNETHDTTSTGYIRNDFVDPYTGGSDGGGSTASDIKVGDTVVTIKPGVNFRSTPGGNSLFQVSTGTTMVVNAITTSDGFTWYKGVLSSKTGYLRGDCVEKYTGDSSGATESYTVGHLGKLKKTQVYVRKAASTSAKSYGKLTPNTCKFIISGTEQGGAVNGNTTWVKIRYGTASGGNVTAYIHSSCIVDIGTPKNTAKERCIEIAESLKGVSGATLGLGGSCCQNFIYWLCGACGKTVAKMPYGQSLCGPARDYFKISGQGTWHEFGSGYVPQAGDLVYYTSSTDGASSHVGLVTGSGSNSFASTGYTSIEGNLSDCVKECHGDYLSGKCGDNNKTVQCFVTPLWI